MIDVQQSARKPAASAYATLPIRTTKDRCVALALATTNLTSGALVLAAWIWANTIYSPHGFSSLVWVYTDIQGTLGPFNSLTTVLCILASYLCQGRRWRVLFALCSLLGTLCLCLMTFQGQLYRE
jgi:hypothetical protein